MALGTQAQGADVELIKGVGWTLSLFPCHFPTPALPGRVVTPAALWLGPWSPREGSEASLCAVRCGGRWFPVQVLYSLWALPHRRPGGMSLPFSSHIWVLDTRDPSSGRFAAWAPARSPLLTKEGAVWPGPR